MDKTQKTVISVLALVFALMLGALVVLPAAIDRGSVTGDFVRPEFDPSAVSGTPQPDAALQFAWLQIGDDIKAGLCGRPVYTREGVALYFASDASNTAWLMAIVLDEDGKQIGATGLIRPGEYVTQVALNKQLQGSVNVTVRIVSYEPETYYSLGSAAASVTLRPAEE